MKSRSILVMCPNAMDATSFYRGFGPMGALKRHMNLSIASATELNWASLGLADLIFLQRPFDMTHVKAIEISKSNRKPVWVDYDDDLINIQPDNPSFRTYGSKEVKKNVQAIIEMADVVTVSTPFLKNQLGQRSEKVIVIPNALNDFIFKDRKRENVVRSNRMACWRGSSTHEKDLMSVGSQLIELSHKLKDMSFCFVAYNPWFITEAMHDKRTMVVDGMDVIEYHKFMAKIAPAIQVVPLHDSPFNRSKSNIAWIESCWAGAVTVAPSWQEWERPGVVNYSNPKDFFDCVKELSECTDLALSKQNQLGWEFICDNLLLSKVNEMRIKIINDLC